MAKKKKSAKKRASECLEFAENYLNGNPDASWTELHNAVFGIGGFYSTLFDTPEERAKFVQTEENSAIMAMINDRMDIGVAPIDKTPSGRVLLRLPKSLHAALVAEAELEGISLNQLILSKLALQLSAAVR